MENPSGIFREEAVELLVVLEQHLLDLEKNPGSSELINEIFRALHTLKGSGSMFGFTDLASFVHNIENVFDRVRKGEIALDKNLIDLTLEARDLMKLLIALDVEVPLENKKRIEELTAIFSRLSAEIPASEGKKTAEPSAKNDTEKKDAVLPPAAPHTFYISFKPHHEFFASGNNPLNIIRELSDLGTLVHTRVLTDAIPDLKTINPEFCYLGWEFELQTTQDINAVRDVFLFVEDICHLKIKAADNEVFSSSGAVERVAMAATTLTEHEKHDIHTSGGQQVASHSPDGEISGINVDAGKLDRLIGLLGELVTIQSRLSQVADLKGDTELTAISQELDSLTGELRDNALKLSMLPIDSIFPRLERFAVSEAASHDKLVRFQFSGGDTELDKGVLSRLLEPLVTLISFCIRFSHEDTVSRLEYNKDPRALVAISAWHSSGSVCLSVEDDGVPAKFPDSDSSGLTKVQKIIEDLRGTFEARLMPGKPSGFVIKLPLNLAIIEGLMIRLGDRLFVFPLSLVEECIELTREDQNKHYNKNVVMVRGQIVPFISLREKLGFDGSPPDVQQVVIINQNGRRVGFAVDQVVGEYQTVLKNWGKFCSNTPGIAGATILGDGSIALIVDLPVLIDEESNLIEEDTF